MPNFAATSTSVTLDYSLFVVSVLDIVIGNVILVSRVINNKYKCYITGVVLWGLGHG